MMEKKKTRISVKPMASSSLTNLNTEFEALAARERRSRGIRDGAV